MLYFLLVGIQNVLIFTHHLVPALLLDVVAFYEDLDFMDGSLGSLVADNFIEPSDHLFHLLMTQGEVLDLLIEPGNFRKYFLF